MGYRFSPQFVDNLIAKYNPKGRRLTLDNFIVAFAQGLTWSNLSTVAHHTAVPLFYSYSMGGGRGSDGVKLFSIVQMRP